jgi:hypothetical protein
LFSGEFPPAASEVPSSVPIRPATATPEVPVLRNRRARVLLALTALSLVAAAFAWQCRHQPPDLPADEAGLAARLQALGYHVHEEPADRRTPEGRLVLAGLYCWRDGAATTWEEGAAQMAGQAARWRGLVVARPAPRGLGAEPAPETLQAGGWVLLGDPAELDRLARALGEAR